LIMGRGIIRDDVTDNAGNAIQGKEVTIYIADTVTKATLYDASTGGSEIGNPVVTDEDGVFEAYADTGEYEVEIDGQIEGRYNAVDGDELADLLAIKDIGGLTTADKVTYDGESANVKLALDARVPTVGTLGELAASLTSLIIAVGDSRKCRYYDNNNVTGSGAEWQCINTSSSAPAGAETGTANGRKYWLPVDSGNGYLVVENTAGGTCSQFHNIEGLKTYTQYGAIGDGTAVDSPSIKAFYAANKFYAGEVGRFRIAAADCPIALAQGTFMGAVGIASNYANPGGQIDGTRYLIDCNETKDIFTITGGTLDGTAVNISGSFSSHANSAGVDQSGRTIRCFVLTDTFFVNFKGAVFEHLNVSDAIDTAGACNETLVDSDCIFALIGDTTGALEAITGGYTYGNGVDLSSSADSKCHAFIEACGGTGLRMSADSNFDSVWINLCNRGFSFTGKNVQGRGYDIKLNREWGIQPSTNATDFYIGPGVCKYNNYANATGTADATFNIRLTSGHSGFVIDGADLEDDLSEIPTHSSNKTTLSNGIHLGAAGNTGVIRDVKFGDTEASGARIHDPNGNWASGNIQVLGHIVTGSTNNLNGINIPLASSVDIGGGNVVRGAAGSRAMNAQYDTIVSGVVRSKGNGTLLRASRSTIGPKFVSDAAPATAIVTKVGGANGGAVGVTGWSFPVTFSHTGSGGAENMNIYALPDRAAGRITVVYGDGGTDSFMISATIVWDGTTLTVSDSITHNSGFGAPSLVNNAGTLAVSASKASAESGNMQVHFEGFWAEV
ncbi:hypothetical protein, partial [Zhongshania sp.]|uniref:hypothetical protein n=1 Tax=Zhongshania sp. TaxID=1971902 RepID=UPI003568299E